MDKDNTKAVWRDLRQQQERLSGVSLSQLFQNNPNRLDNYSTSAAELYLDYSKNPIDKVIRSELCKLAEQSGLHTWIEKLFNGETVNLSERRAATHTALRDKPNLAQLENAIANIHQKKYDTIVHIGVGGSDLGPRLLYSALKDFYQSDLNVYFVSELDSDEINDVLAKIKAEKTLFIIVSKSFSTIETMQNATIAKHWMQTKNIAWQEHFIAVTAEEAKAVEWGVDPASVLFFDRGVGGRFSIWSSVSLVIALVIGVKNFLDFLAGAKTMDCHFQDAPFAENMPVMLALMDIWLLNICGGESRCIVPYSYRLRLLPDYLQQLHMESLGKSVQQDGSAAFCKTGGVLWGKHATSSQHSFHQQFLQGNRMMPVDFILPQANNQDVENTALIANCLSQSELLARGVKKENVFQTVDGNKPHSLILMKKITPFTLGALLALYEHKVFSLGVIWNINAFDQWGVEEGKKLAKSISKLTLNKALYEKIKNEDREVEYQ